MITDAAIIANSDALKAGWGKRRMTWLDHHMARLAAELARKDSADSVKSRQRLQNEHRTRMLWFENRADGSI